MPPSAISSLTVIYFLEPTGVGRVAGCTLLTLSESQVASKEDPSASRSSLQRGSWRRRDCSWTVWNHLTCHHVSLAWCLKWGFRNTDWLSLLHIQSSKLEAAIDFSGKRRGGFQDQTPSLLLTLAHDLELITEPLSAHL